MKKKEWLKLEKDKYSSDILISVSFLNNPPLYMKRAMF